MTRIVVGPFSRVEGDLEVTLEVEDGAVREARVSSQLFRGFERILIGKIPLDALAVVPRICGICSVSQSSAVARALAGAAGLEPPKNGRTAGNLMLAAENMADHLTHFYLFFMPDFARPAYSQRHWYPLVRQRFEAMRGSGGVEALASRARFLELVAILGGKWPHTLAIQPGGSSRAVQRAERVQLLLVLREFRKFLEKTLFGDQLERIAGLGSLAALAGWRDARPAADSDFRLFLEVAGDLEIEKLGRGPDTFMSYGAYDDGDRPHFAAGVFEGEVHPLEQGAIREDGSHAWLQEGAPRHPAEGLTQPAPDKSGAYTWCKAPRLGGKVVEVGALARQVVDGHPLARQLVASGGGNVFSRVLARLLELALVVPAMERWVSTFQPGEPFCLPGEIPDGAVSFGLVEAARGSLGHWLTVGEGRIRGYQIVAPTTWNFSPRDGEGRCGPLEQALVGTPVGGRLGEVLVQHVVRSFDPCMVCTVH